MTGRELAVFTIPSGISFADSLAARLLRQHRDAPADLPNSLILLPTRRACRVVRDAFLRQSEGAALLLPRLQALGDVDEDALSLDSLALGQESFADLPPALPQLRRRLMLARLIMARPDQSNTPEQALLLADALGALMDKIYTEDLDFARLPGLVDPALFADHWGLTLKFLTILSEAWPKVLAEIGMIDTADRRNRLLRALADFWEKKPPTHPVIAAGSTGSIPASGRLLHLVAGLPQGMLVLPGLDLWMDEKSWDALDDSHPQATLKALLVKMNLARGKVRLWEDGVVARRALAAEMMRPAATTDLWRDLAAKPQAVADGIVNLTRIDCPTAQDEAEAVALIFRSIQHQPGRTGALVTFDRNLARRVIAACARWGLEIDDSAGIPLPGTAAGTFLLLCAETCIEALAPVPLLALLKHGRARAGMDVTRFRTATRLLDKKMLRGTRPGAGIAGLRARLPGGDPGGEAGDLPHLVDRLEVCLSPLLALCDGRRHGLGAFVQAHLQAAEAMAADLELGGPDRLWAGDDGEAAALFFGDLLDHAAEMEPITAADYLPLLQTMMRGISVRMAWGMHPRLSILGPLEARLLNAETVILGGLNEGSWPPAAENDPWMSRPMRKDFGLPPPERGTGLSAHDFINGFCAPTVILTRAERAGTAPTVPSRWLRRLDAVLAAAGLPLPQTEWLGMAARVDQPEAVSPIGRPDPRPPAAKRPSALSVTEIETWIRDPYSIYARHVLSLRAFDPIDEKPGAADKGTIIHGILQDFISSAPDRLPEDALDTLLTLGRDELAAKIDDIQTRYFWTVRFEQMADWFVSNERDWRTRARPLALETEGQMTLPDRGFALRGKADRIDLMKDGSGVAIIDYKTGAAPSAGDVEAGLSPQLTLEAAMVAHGAFPDIHRKQAGYLGYWKLSGKDGGKKTEIENIDTLAKDALAGLQEMVDLFADEKTPYLSQPRPRARPRYSDYTHLARVREWAVIDGGGEGGE